MDQTPQTERYDYRRYDRIWQRVAPGLDPYPNVRTAAQAEDTEATQPSQAAQPNGSTALTPAQVRQESQLPGAELNPCCMGSAAAEMLEVLTGYIEEELDDRRYYLALMRCAPAWARQILHTIADSEGSHAKRLMAVYYLITGQCYRPNVACGAVPVERWCPALRRRFHEEVCSGMNYARSAEGTTDICLQRIFQELSADEYHHADLVSKLLERSLR